MSTDLDVRADDVTIFDFCAGSGMLSEGVCVALDAMGLRGRVVGYVEREAAAAASIVARMEGTQMGYAPIWDDAGTFEGTAWRGCVDVFTAGYPCQPFSTAGKRRGKRDPRHIWPLVRRAIEEIKPCLVFLENVSGHLSLGFETVAAELEEMGFGVAPGLFSSQEVGAKHRRVRLFILAIAPGMQCGPGCPAGEQDRRTGQTLHNTDQSDAELVDPHRSGSQGLGPGNPPRRVEPEPRCGTELPFTESINVQGRIDGQGKKQLGGSSGELAFTERLRSRTGVAGEQEKTGGRRRGPSDSGDQLDVAPSCGCEGVELPTRSRDQGARTLLVAGGSEDLPLYAPGRNDWEAWGLVARMDPALMPALEPDFCSLVNGMASRTDQIRIIGQGVDPMAAAYAFTTLAACLLD